MKKAKSSSVKDNPALKRYLDEISVTPLLTRQEERKLIRRIRRGDAEALDKLVKANLRFVVRIANRYSDYGLPILDLINEGNLGLIKAAQSFDESRGLKFITYAVWWIRQAILQALSEQLRIVRLPQNQITALHKVDRAMEDLEQRFERRPTASEIGEELGVDSAEVLDILQLGQRQISLDEPLLNPENGEQHRLLDVISDDFVPQPGDSIRLESLKNELNSALEMLNEREALVLRLFFGLDRDGPMSLAEIGEQLNLSRERIRQIKERALQRLRRSNKVREGLWGYLG